MPPGSIFHHIISLLFTLDLVYYFAIYRTKYQKYLSCYVYQISLLQVAVKGMTTPLSRWLQGSWLFVQVLGDLRVISYWIDTLVLKNWGKYLRYCAASPFLFKGKPTHAQEVHWVTRMWAQEASGPHVSDTTAPAVMSLKLSPLEKKLLFGSARHGCYG